MTARRKPERPAKCSTHLWPHCTCGLSMPSPIPGEFARWTVEICDDGNGLIRYTDGDRMTWPRMTEVVDLLNAARVELKPTKGRGR
jgi:hypothetical protein